MWLSLFTPALGWIGTVSMSIQAVILHLKFRLCFLLIQGGIGTVQIFTAYWIIPDMLNNFYNYYYRINSAFNSIPFILNMFALIIVQHCSMTIIAAWIM